VEVDENPETMGRSGLNRFLDPRPSSREHIAVWLKVGVVQHLWTRRREVIIADLSGQTVAPLPLPIPKSGMAPYPTYRDPNTVEPPLFDPLPILIRDPAVPVSFQYRLRVLSLGDIQIASLGLLRIPEHVAVEERFLHEPRAEVDSALLSVPRDIGG
jgi:hypothetical protein